MPAAVFPTEPLELRSLVCHPALPDGAVSGIAVTLAAGPDGLVIRYRLDGDLAALRVPDPATPLPPERLWAHTCFELFVAQAGVAGYREFNFSPNGQWMRFDFADYRQRIASPASAAPRIETRRDAAGLELDVTLGVEQFPPGDLVIGLTAVVEHADGSHAYWALRHPAAQPDFHHRDGFALALKAVNP